MDLRATRAMGTGHATVAALATARAAAHIRLWMACGMHLKPVKSAMMDGSDQIALEIVPLFWNQGFRAVVVVIAPQGREAPVSASVKLDFRERTAQSALQAILAHHAARAPSPNLACVVVTALATMASMAAASAVVKRIS